MVELRRRKREMSGEGVKHHAEQGLERISYTSQFTISDAADMSPYAASTITHTWSSQHNHASHGPDFSCPLVSSTSCSSSSPNSLDIIRNSTINAEHKVKSSLSITLCHDHEWTRSTEYTEYSIHQVQLTPGTAYSEYSKHPVQHTPSTAYAQYSIHWVLHTPSTAYTKYNIYPGSFIFPSFPWFQVDHWV